MAVVVKDDRNCSHYLRVGLPILLDKTAPDQVPEKLGAIPFLGLQDCAERAPFQLSHGQRQPAALAGLLARRPSLLLLDEPTDHLDTPGRADLLRILQRQSAAQLVATHELFFAARLCHSYLWREEGRIPDSGENLRLLMRSLARREREKPR